MKSYYFNNNFKQIIKLRNELYYSEEINNSDLLKLKQLISEYGIVEFDKYFTFNSDSYRIECVDEWLSFEYPDIESYEDLKECRNEPNLLEELYKELLNKTIIKDEITVEKVKVSENEVEKLDATNIQKVVMVGIPVGLITLIGFLANL